jgi:predicted metal-dependent phosphoesterase TrpH
MQDYLADLHSHSYYSDGIFSPSEVVRAAKDAGCDIFALTDHDTIDGLEEAQKKATELGLNLITGCEISATWNNMTIHIVALNFDKESLELQKLLKHHQGLRRLRAEKIAQGLAASGIEKPLEKTKELVQKDMVTRTHFARMLIKNGICKDMKSVFSRYLTGKKPGGVSVAWSDLQSVVNTIKVSGGVSIIAHPLRYRMTNTKIKRLFAEFKEMGGDGVEVITGSSTFENIELVAKWSRDADLKQSVGSDFHGDNDYIKIGKLKNVQLSNNIVSILCC